MAPLSPCISICDLDEIRGWCKGCYRTLEEITDWPELSEKEKNDLLLILEERERIFPKNG